MSYNLYVIFDKKSCYQPQIYSFGNDETAQRFCYQLYHDALDRDSNSPLASFPEDFDLYCIGTFDSDGDLTSLPNPRYVCPFIAFREV